MTGLAALTLNLLGVELSVAPCRSCREPPLPKSCAFTRSTWLIYSMWTCCSTAYMCVCACVRLQRVHASAMPLHAGGHILAALLSSRCTGTGRLYMASKTGSYYQRPLTRVCTFLVHLRVYGPADKEAKFILCPLSVAPCQSHERLDSNSAHIASPHLLYCFMCSL